MAFSESRARETKGAVLGALKARRADACCGADKRGKRKKAAPTQHPDHHAQRVGLRRVRGQIAGLEKMIEERRYCVEVLTQLKAAYSSLRAVESSILKTHLLTCVTGAVESKNPREAEIKINELLKLLAGR